MVLLAFFILAIQLFVTLIEFKLSTVAGFVLIPFGLFGKYAFMAERVLGNVISSGIKVMVLAVIVGIGSTLTAGFAAALVWQSAHGTIVPWVVQVDRLGQAQAVAPATADYAPTDPQIAWYLARFVEQVRSIPADPIIVRQDWLRAYDFTTSSGAIALNEYARANDPFERSANSRSLSMSPASSAHRPTRSAWRGRSTAMRTVRSPRPRAGPPSLPSSCKRQRMPIACGRTRLESMSTPSTGHGSLGNEAVFP
jgi:hypothetical protein